MLLCQTWIRPFLQNRANEQLAAMNSCPLILVRIHIHCTCMWMLIFVCLHCEAVLLSSLWSQASCLKESTFGRPRWQKVSVPPTAPLLLLLCACLYNFVWKKKWLRRRTQGKTQSSSQQIDSQLHHCRFFFFSDFSALAQKEACWWAVNPQHKKTLCFKMWPRFELLPLNIATEKNPTIIVVGFFSKYEY